MSTTPRRSPRYLTMAACLLAAICLNACNRSTPSGKPSADQSGATSPDHDGHDHDEHALPTTFAEGVSELKEHYQEIKTAFAQADAKKAVEEAHDPLHHVGEILEALPELAKKADLSAEQLETISKSVGTMFDSYGNIDDAVHDEKSPDYAAVAEKLDEAMAAIEGVSSPEQGPAPVIDPQQ